MTPGIPWMSLYNAATLPPDPTEVDCSISDFFFNSAAWQACQTAKSRAQQQAVVNRATNYYGANSPAARAAQAAADAADAGLPIDSANIANYYGAGSMIASPPAGNDASGMPTWVMVALLVGSLYLLRNMNS